MRNFHPFLQFQRSTRTCCSGRWKIRWHGINDFLRARGGDRDAIRTGFIRLEAFGPLTADRPPKVPIGH